MTPIVWVGDSKDEVKSFPDDARRNAGFQLSNVQHGKEPNDWKPMSSIGPGVREIRIREATGAFRVVYVLRFRQAIYVLHAFQKKTHKTRTSDIELARERLRSIPR
jgi:phage-related protein